jgi:phage terminase large subunit
MKQKLVVRIEPRSQFETFLRSKARWSVLAAHRRAGKTVAVVQKLILAAMTHTRPGPLLRYAYLAPTRDQAKDIAWQYLKDYTSKIPGVVPNESELRINFATVTHPQGAQIRLYSGENYERMRGLYFDGVASDEDADIPPQAFSYVILPCLLDYDGWHVRMGTPKGRNAFYKALLKAREDPESFSLVLKASETGILKEKDLETIRAQMIAQMGIDQGVAAYQQEMECDFSVGRVGALYARLIEESRLGGRVIDFPWDRSQLTWTTWDLGSPKNTRVVYWQFVGREIHAIDHDDGGKEMGPTERVAHMLAKPYHYAGHLLPHDARSQEKCGKSFQEQLSEAGLTGIQIIPRCIGEWPGVNKVCEMLPRMVFHRTNCEKLLDSLENYHVKEVAKDGSLTNILVDDWSAHDSDCVRMLAEAMMNDMVKGHSEVIREIRPISQRQRTATAGRYTR